MRGYVICRHVITYHMPKNNGLIFHMGEVSELWIEIILITFMITEG